IADVHVSPEVGDAVRQEPAERGVGPPHDVLRREALHALGPDLDALEQGAAAVRSGLALREDRVEVEVRLDEGRRRPAAPGRHWGSIPPAPRSANAGATRAIRSPRTPMSTGRSPPATRARRITRSKEASPRGRGATRAADGSRRASLGREPRDPGGRGSGT